MAKAKTLTEEDFARALRAAAEHKDLGRRNVVILTLSFKAGLRACEIAALTWRMVTDANGMIAEVISLPAEATKGSYGQRDIPMHAMIKTALRELLAEADPEDIAPDMPVVRSPKDGGRGFDGHGIVCWLWTFYRKLGLSASSHSGRRTFITRGARRISKAGGSLRDVQALAGHKSLATTELYIDENESAKRRLIADL